MTQILKTILLTEIKIWKTKKVKKKEQFKYGYNNEYIWYYKVVTSSRDALPFTIISCSQEFHFNILFYYLIIKIKGIQTGASKLI